MQHLTWKEKHLQCIFMNCYIFTLTHEILENRNPALLPVFLCRDLCLRTQRCWMLHALLFLGCILPAVQRCCTSAPGPSRVMQKMCTAEPCDFQIRKSGMIIETPNLFCQPNFLSLGVWKMEGPQIHKSATRKDTKLPLAPCPLYARQDIQCRVFTP